MKTEIKIVIETRDVIGVYNSDNPEEWTPDNVITEDVDREFHDKLDDLIRRYVELNLSDDFFDDNEILPEGVDSFSDFGQVTITMTSAVLDKETYQKNAEKKKEDD